MNNEQKVNKITNELSNAVQSSVMETLAAVMASGLETSAPGHLAIAMSAALYAMLPVCPVVGRVKRAPTEDQVTDELIESQINRSLNQEVLTFIAIYTALMFDGGDLRINTAAEKVSQDVQTSCCVAKLGLTLQRWQLLYPDKNPEDFLEPQLVVAARRGLLEVDGPFSDFIKTRPTHRNPGSIN